VLEGLGFTFQRRDVTDLQHMLELPIPDPEMREVAVRAAERRIREDFLWPQIAREIAQVYRSVMEPRRGVDFSATGAEVEVARQRAA
jgi:glycosyltransferase involved in cell wall biosynthesis